MLVALVPGVEEVLRSDRVVDNREEVPPEDVVEVGVDNGILFIFFVQRFLTSKCDYRSDIDYDRFDHQTGSHF